METVTTAQAGAVLRQATVAEVCEQRNRALRLYDVAYDALVAADDAITAARVASKAAAPRANRFNQHLSEDKAHHHVNIKLPERAAYLETARRIVDTDVWAHLVEVTELERLMDKKAKDDLYQQLVNDPPEATLETVFATLTQLLCDSDLIFKRGIANCFSNLDRRFRSHDGWKIGSRAVLTYAFCTMFGSWNYDRNQRDTLQDIERTFFILDGKQQPPNYGGIVGAVEQDRRGKGGPHQSETETDYFLVRGYKNGNAHVWFKRDDLLTKVNQLLGEYYGAPIPEEREPDRATSDLHAAKTTPAKNYGYFPTPDKLAAHVIDRTPFYRAEGDPELRLLEPSAGGGALARAAVAEGARVDCVEIQADLAERLKASGLYDGVIRADFLSLNPAPIYDRILMNPPFDRERDIDHVVHAMKFLKPDGFLCAIMSAGTEFRETRKSIAFRDAMAGKNADWRDLPAGSFASVGTYCNTVLLRFWNTGRSVSF